MIPKIIHQTWKNHKLPVPKRLPESWQNLNPDWEYRFWTDDQLDDFVRQSYPQVYALYQSCTVPVKKADIARYLILHKFGGIYADIDTECLSNLDILINENRIILCEEPSEHWQNQFSGHRDMSTMVFNGTMASPAGHRFWEYVIKVLHRCRHAQKDLLEATGPLMLSGCVINYDNPDELALHSCHLFSPNTKDKGPSKDKVWGPLAPAIISDHLWKGTWFRKDFFKWKAPIRFVVFGARYWLTRGPYLSRATLKQTVDLTMLRAPLVDEKSPNIAIMIPVRDCARFLDRCFELLLALDYPKTRIKITFCEGNSTDNTVALLKEFITANQDNYREINLIHLENDLKFNRQHRAKPRFQKKRRSALAKVRNHLIKHGLTTDDSWALWIDADVVDYPADILNVLLAAQEKIVTPDCLLENGGPSFDLNAFLDVSNSKYRTDYYHYAQFGLFQPPQSYHWRRHLHDMRYLSRVPLTSVGGTMLLVHASVHQAGVSFPEIPYCDLLETEGFGKMAGDLGVTPIGLPNTHIYHSKT